MSEHERSPSPHGRSHDLRPKDLDPNPKDQALPQLRRKDDGGDSIDAPPSLDGLSQTEPDAPDTRASSPSALAANDPCWWWAPAHTLPYKPRSVTAAAGDPSSTMLDDTFARRVSGEIQGWLDQPLVWRDDGTTVQAVLLGMLRYTWSRQLPEGRLEAFHLDDGWRSVLSDQMVSFGHGSPLFDLHQVLPHTLLARRPNPSASMLRETLVIHMVEAVLQHNARQAQQASSVRRATLWTLHEEPRRRSWAPVFFDVPGQELATTRSWATQLHRLLPETLAACWIHDRHLPHTLTRLVWNRLRTAAVGLLHTLNAHSPLWGALRRLSVWPNTRVDAAGLPWVQRCFQNMDAWEQRLREQPHATLMLPFVDDMGLVPNANLWREDVWVPRLLPTPQAWRFALRQGPMASVRAMLHRGGFNGGWFDLTGQQLPALGAMSSLPEALDAVPSAAWRLVPPDVWTHVAQGDRGMVVDDEADHEDSEGDPLVRNRWHREALRAYLRAVQARPWIVQQVSMTVWLKACRPVWDWVLLNNSCPFQDPSWSWLSLMDLATARAPVYSPAWGSLLHPGRVGRAVITPVNSPEQWKTLGILLQNCLKDSRSDMHQTAVKNRRAFLYRLDLNGRSSMVVIGLNHPGTDDEQWNVVEQRSTANTHAPVEHVRLARGLAELHDLYLRQRPWHRRMLDRWRPDSALDRLEIPRAMEVSFSHDQWADLRSLINPRWSVRPSKGRWSTIMQRLLPQTWLNALWAMWAEDMAPLSLASRWTSVLFTGMVLGGIALVVSAVLTVLMGGIVLF